MASTRQRSTYKRSQLVCLTGPRLGDTACCQPAETFERTERQNNNNCDVRLLFICTVIAVSATSDTQYACSTPAVIYDWNSNCCQTR